MAWATSLMSAGPPLSEEGPSPDQFIHNLWTTLGSVTQM
jgi:hypothetical protein